MGPACPRDSGTGLIYALVNFSTPRQFWRCGARETPFSHYAVAG